MLASLFKLKPMQLVDLQTIALVRSIKRLDFVMAHHFMVGELEINAKYFEGYVNKVLWPNAFEKGYIYRAKNGRIELTEKGKTA